MSQEIFVFGSNLGGFHGAGSAKHALDHFGAKWGCGVGHNGNSYAIPTKDKDFRVLTLNEIAPHVWNFLKFAHHRKEWKFNIVAIGCGLAGYAPKQIASMFKDAPENCNLPEEFKQVLEANYAN